MVWIAQHYIPQSIVRIKKKTMMIYDKCRVSLNLYNSLSKKKQKKVMTVILSQAHEQWNRKDNSLLPLKAHWVTLTLSAATLPACIYCLDSLNQFSMCQALPNRAKMARTSKTLAVSAWRSGCHVCWLSPGQQGWRCAWARWQHVAELQDCQTMNVSMTPTVPHQMHQSWVDENSHSRSDTRRHERVFD